MKIMNVATIVLGLACISCTRGAPDIEPTPYPVLQESFTTQPVFQHPASIVFDPVTRQLFVSNVNGHPMAKDGNGFISKVAINGDVRDLHWLTGLNAPKGMTLIGDLLYVTDIDQLVIVDITNREKSIIPVANAVFLKDISHDASGVVYFSDTLTDTIYSFRNNNVAVWLQGKTLLAPNGLYSGDGFLYVGGFGRMADDSSAKMDGDLLRIQLETKEVTVVARHLGNVDGVERYAEFFILTDHDAGILILMDKMGQVQEMRTIGQGAADLCVLPEDWELLVVPMMQDNILKGFTVKYDP